MTLPASRARTGGYSVGGMIAFEAGLLAVGVLLVLSPRLGAHHAHHGVLLGVAAGILFGVSDVAIKALTTNVEAVGVSPASPRRGSSPASSAPIIAFFASARGLQTG